MQEAYINFYETQEGEGVRGENIRGIRFLRAAEPLFSKRQISGVAVIFEKIEFR